MIGVDHTELPKNTDNPVWKRIGYYIAQLCLNVFLLTSVEKIVIGGGIASHPHLLSYVTTDFDILLNGYVKLPTERPNGQHPIIVSAMRNHMSELYGAVMSVQE